MTHSIYPEYPPDLDMERSKYLLENLKDKACTTGFLVKPLATGNGELPEGAIPAPITLFPSLFPSSCFDNAQNIQKQYNLLYASIASDEEWLESIVSTLVGIDDFVENLWKIHLDLRNGGYIQPLSLGLFRSDYMIHVDKPPSSPKPQLKQVEFNTIASSFGGLSTRAAIVHKFLVDIEAYPKEVDNILRVEKLPENETASQLAEGLAFAHKTYLETTSTKNEACVLFVVQHNERNVFDQRHLEEPLLDNFNIRTYRVTFHNVLEETMLSDDGSLLFCPPHLPGRVFEVSVVYFRAGYSPQEYQSEKAWAARKELERSRAIKCPSVLTQLAGLKKVQQVLATPDSKYLERFIKNPIHAESLRQTFAPMYPMDQSEAGLEGRRLALDAQSAKRFVLKPQREGGGNNIYREAIPTFLKGKAEKEWEAYILMEMIEPPPQRNAIYRNGMIESGGVICELGVYGVCLWEHGTQPKDSKRGVIHNSLAGYLLRTKGDQSEEGGVAAGFGALDSVCLVSGEKLRAIGDGIVEANS